MVSRFLNFIEAWQTVTQEILLSKWAIVLQYNNILNIVDNHDTVIDMSRSAKSQCFAHMAGCHGAYSVEF